MTWSSNAYRPKARCEDALLALTREHVPFLRGLGLVTSRPHVAMRAADGVIVEVFEWRDGGVEAAHGHPEVGALWARYALVCDYVTLSELAEARDLFATFRPIDFGDASLRA